MLPRVTTVGLPWHGPPLTLHAPGGPPISAWSLPVLTNRYAASAERGARRWSGLGRLPAAALHGRRSRERSQGLQEGRWLQKSGGSGDSCTCRWLDRGCYWCMQDEGESVASAQHCVVASLVLCDPAAGSTTHML
jgi:hypothetical protein